MSEVIRAFLFIVAGLFIAWALNDEPGLDWKLYIVYCASYFVHQMLYRGEHNA